MGARNASTGPVYRSRPRWHRRRESGTAAARSVAAADGAGRLERKGGAGHIGRATGAGVRAGSRHLDLLLRPRLGSDYECERNRRRRNSPGTDKSARPRARRRRGRRPTLRHRKTALALGHGRASGLRSHDVAGVDEGYL